MHPFVHGLDRFGAAVVNGAVEGKLAMIRDTHVALDKAASTRQGP